LDGKVTCNSTGDKFITKKPAIDFGRLFCFRGPGDVGRVSSVPETNLLQKSLPLILAGFFVSGDLVMSVWFHRSVMKFPGDAGPFTGFSLQIRRIRGKK